MFDGVSLPNAPVARARVRLPYPYCDSRFVLDDAETYDLEDVPLVSRIVRVVCGPELVGGVGWRSFEGRGCHVGGWPGRTMVHPLVRGQSKTMLRRSCRIPLGR